MTSNLSLLTNFVESRRFVTRCPQCHTFKNDTNTPKQSLNLQISDEDGRGLPQATLQHRIDCAMTPCHMEHRGEDSIECGSHLCGTDRFASNGLVIYSLDAQQQPPRVFVIFLKALVFK